MGIKNQKKDSSDKIDCFAYSRKKCAALTKKKCHGCNFYKTKEELKEGQKKARDRIKTLDEGIQEHIRDRYFKQGGM